MLIQKIKNYTEALKYVEKALVLQPGNNAPVSQIMRLGNASISDNDGNFDEVPQFI
jgi:hypothetical protein